MKSIINLNTIRRVPAIATSILPAVFFCFFKLDLGIITGIFIFLTWAIIELSQELTNENLVAGSVDLDRNSRRIFIYIRHLSFLIPCLELFYRSMSGLPDRFYEINPYILIVCGLFCVGLGTILRFMAMRTLGRFFTMELMIQKNHTIVNKGIYKLVRHPSYLGLFFIFIGFPLMTGSIIGFCLILLLLFPAVFYRIQIEETLMIEKFGISYSKYKKITPCLLPIPFRSLK